MPEPTPLPDGPFETEREVRDHPAVRAIYDAARAGRGPGAIQEQNHRMLCEALSAAGAELGAYDHRVVMWLAQWEPQTVAAVAGMITRAHQAGKAAGT